MRYNNIAAVFAALMLTVTPAKAASLDNILSSITTNSQIQQLDKDTQNQVTCLALNMYHEARGSTYQDILAVGLATRNRVLNSNKTYCQIIWEPGQFVWTKRVISQIRPREKAAWDRVLSIASEVVDGQHEDITFGATSFYSAKLPSAPVWARHRKSIRIGAHYYVKTI